MVLEEEAIVRSYILALSISFEVCCSSEHDVLRACMTTGLSFLMDNSR